MVRAKPANNIFKIRKTWALVANRTGAQIFYLANRTFPFEMLEEIDHPRGALKDGEINSDRPGRVKDRFGGAKHSLMREHRPSEQILIQFCKDLVEKLNKAHVAGRFDDLILVAPAAMLGKLKTNLSKDLRASVTLTKSKDLKPLTKREVLKYLQEITSD